MTAPSTFNLTGTFTEPGGAVSVGLVTVKSTDARFKNNSNILNQLLRPITLDGSGTLGTVTLPQATNGYELLIQLVGHADRTQHIAGTANISVTPSHTNMTVTGTWYSPITGALATGTIEATDLDNGDVYPIPLVSGAISKVLFQNTLGFAIVEKIDGRTAIGQSSYVIPGNASINLTTV